VNRRRFHLVTASALGCFISSPLRSETPAEDPWPRSELMQPADLAARLNSTKPRPHILCVAFPVLYRQRHILHAEYAGPGNKPEGIAALKGAVASLPKDAEIVIYCGCCPMVNCPNVRPAYTALKEESFRKVRVLNIPENFHADWVAKGYPVEAETGIPVRDRR
jgi:thiosulfate/3-mercaptopyruvate sulfurtransferase